MGTLRKLFSPYRSGGIFKRISAMTTAVMAFTLLATVLFSLIYFTRLMERRVTENVSNILEQSNRLIAAKMETYLLVADLIAQEAAILKLLEQGRPVNLGEASVILNGVTDRYTRAYPQIISAFLVNPENDTFIPTRDFAADSYNADEARSRYLGLADPTPVSSLTWIPTHSVDYSSRTESGSKIFKLVKSIYVDEAYKGTLMLNINEESIHGLLKDLKVPQGTIFHMIDPNGIVISGTERNGIGKFEYSYTYMQAVRQKQGSFTKEFRGSRYLFVFNNLEHLNWVMIGAIPFSQMFSEQRIIIRAGIYIFLALLVVSLLGSTWIAYSISKPVYRLNRVMKEARSGNLSVRANASEDHEIGMLGGTFNAMLNQIQGLLERVQESHRKEKEAEIRALQAQINPHFLYNTLSSVIWLAERRDYDGVTDMVSRLGRYYRQGLSRGLNMVSVKQELEHVEHYLSIERMRYGSKFNYIIDVDPDVGSCRCLKLILQPLVENALHHGILQRDTGGGTVRIVGWREEGRVVLTVSDDGAGIPPERLKEMNICFKEGRSMELADSYGIKNVNERIQLHHGREYGLQYESAIGSGTIVRITLPYIEKLLSK